MAEHPILFSASMVRAILAGQKGQRHRLYPRAGETPASPEHLARRLANGLDSAPEDGCWEWKRTRNADGYGLLTVAGRGTLAHRLAYELAGGVLLCGEHVRHTCDNPPCINPAHLRSGGPFENMRDMVSRGRHGGPPPAMVGSKNPASKLTGGQVVEIRERLDAGEVQRVLATEYGVSQSQISNIKRGVKWQR